MSDIYLWETFDRLGREALDRNDFNQANEAFRSAVTTAEELGSYDRLVLSLRNLASVLKSQGRLSDCQELLSRTLEVADQHLGDQHSQTVETHRDLSSACRELGFLDKAEGHLKLVLAFESLHGSAQEQCETLLELAKLALGRDAAHQAAHYYERVVEIKSRELGENHHEVAQALLWLSTALFKSGHQGTAAPSVERAMQILEARFAEEPLHLAQSLLAASQMMEEGAQIESALTYRKRALDLFTEHLPSEDSRIWDARELIASSLAGLGKLEEAVELLEYCLRNREQLEDHRRGGILKNLGGLYLSLGKLEQADEHYIQGAELLGRSLGKEHPIYLATQEERIQYLYFTGRTDDALQLALSMIRATEDRYGPGHPHTAQSYSSTSLLAFKAERWEVALELMRAAEKIWLNLRPQPEDVLANCRTNIASCLQHLGRLDDAEEALQQAEEFAGEALRPLINNIRRQIASQTSETSATEPSGEQSQTPAPLENQNQASVAKEAQTEISAQAVHPTTAPTSSEPESAPTKSESSITNEGECSSREFQAEEGVLAENTEPYLEESVVAVVEPEPRPAVKSDELPEVLPAEVAAREASQNEFVERRRSPRASLTLNQFFDLKVTSESNSLPLQVRSFFVDLGLGGFRVNSERPLSSNAELSVSLPSEVLGEEMDVKAQVVWQKPLFGESYLQGLQFADLSEEQAQLIHQKLDGESGTRNSRQHFRLYRPFPIKLRSESEESWVSSYATDLSLDGLGTRLNSSLSAGEEIKVRLELDFELPTVEVEARVAWSKEGENGVTHGLQFASMGPVEAKTIKRYIDRCLEFSLE